MGKKLKGWTPEDQEPMGGRSNSSALPNLEMKLAVTMGTGGAVQPRRLAPRQRKVQQVHFEDGSTCECGPRCAERSTCCDDWDELCRLGIDPDVEPPPPCAVPVDPPLTSTARNGSAVRLTFLNHAPYPLRVFFVSQGGEEVVMGALNADGHTLTFESSDSHAWALRSWGGVTVMELEPLQGRAALTTVDVYECDLASAGRRLHYGWK